MMRWGGASGTECSTDDEEVATCQRSSFCAIKLQPLHSSGSWLLPTFRAKGKSRRRANQAISDAVVITFRKGLGVLPVTRFKNFTKLGASLNPS